MRSPSPSIAIAGSTGLLGKALRQALTMRGCRVIRLVRTKPHQDSSHEVYWNPASGYIEYVALEDVDVIINLNGAALGQKNWTPERKKLLFESRIFSTRLLAKTISSLKRPPKLFLSASATGYYGSSSPDLALDESSPVGKGFLAELCQEWEQATEKVEAKGIRTIHLRTGIVLDSQTPFLKQLVSLFNWGLGATVGSGEQMMSWITLRDWVAACEFLIFESTLQGAMNLTAPNPVSNLEFCRTLASVLKRPCRFHVPDSLLLWRYGAMGSSLMLEGSKVLPARLLKEGFEFSYPELRQALELCKA